MANPPFMDRIVDSWVQSQQAIADRIASGTQPPIVMIGTNFPTVITWNIAYFSVVGILYFIMSRREEDFKQQLRPIIVVYNAICVYLAAYVVYGLVAWKLQYPDDLRFVCNDGVKTGPKAEQLAWVLWVFCAQKYWEFLDTCLFVLRKKFDQLSFLHLYHHSSITFIGFIIVPYDYNGDVYLPMVLNAMIHVMMYSHYMVTAMGYRSWWSKYLTSAQLIQFVIIAAQNVYSWFAGPSCGSPDWCKLAMFFYMASMVTLFTNFYIKKYSKKTPKAPVKANGVSKKEE